MLKFYEGSIEHRDTREVVRVIAMKVSQTTWFVCMQRLITWWDTTGQLDNGEKVIVFTMIRQVRMKNWELWALIGGMNMNIKQGTCREQMLGLKRSYVKHHSQGGLGNKILRLTPITTLVHVFRGLGNSQLSNSRRIQRRMGWHC